MMKKYIPERLFIFIISLISIIAIYMIYQTIVIDKIQYENFDPNPYSNTYFPPEERLHSSTEVYDTIDPNLNLAPIKELRDVPDVNLGSQLRSVKFQYNKVLVPKMEPKANILSSNTNLNLPTSVSITFMQPNKTQRTVRNVEIPDLSRAYYLYVPVRWLYLTKEVNNLTNKVLIIPEGNFASRNSREAEWKASNGFVPGDYYIFTTQGNSSTIMKIQIYKLVGTTWTEVFTKDNRSNLTDLRKEYSFEFDGDREHVIYEPSNENEYNNFTNAVNNFKRTRDIFQIQGRSFMLKCPYSYYQQPGTPSVQGFILSGFNVSNNNVLTPVHSNLSNSLFNLNSFTVGAGGWKLSQIPISRNVGTGTVARMAGFPLTDPKLKLVGQTVFTMPAPILGQPRINKIKLRAIVNGIFSLALNGSTEKLINLPNGGTGDVELVIQDPSKGKTWDFVFVWEEPTNRIPGQDLSFEIQYQTTDETNQVSEFKLIPSQMLSAPQPYYLGFSSTGTQRDSEVYLTKAEAITYRPSVGGTRATGVIEYLPKIEWEVESLVAPLDSVWSMTGEQESTSLSGFVRIRSKSMENNDAVYYLVVNPESGNLGVSLDGGGFQSAWSMVTVNNLPNTFYIRSAYEGLNKTYLSYQYIKRNNQGSIPYLLRSNVTLTKDPCPWNLVYTTNPQ